MARPVMVSTARPDASTVWLERTQAACSAACAPTWRGPWDPGREWSTFEGVISTVARVGGHEVRPDQLRHGDLDGDEDGQGDRHRGHDAAQDSIPTVDAEGEGEGGVADRDDAARAEQQRRSQLAQARSSRGVDALSSGSDHQVTARLQQPGGGHGGQADDGRA